MKSNLTFKQKKILDFIVEFINLNDYAPTYQEIADHFKIASKATIFEHIKALEDKGHLKAVSGRIRGLEPLEYLSSQKPALELPLVGLITAGEPIEAIEDKETIAIPSDLVKDENAFVLKVKGESMREEGILEGDYVVCERNFYPHNGDVVVALLDNTYATLKKYFRERNRIRLQPANSKMKPLYVKNPAIQGIVRAVIRKFQTI